jgi:hypothetical protein
MTTLLVPPHRVPPPKESMKRSEKSRRLGHVEPNKVRAGSRGCLGSTPSIKHQDSEGDTLNVTAPNSPEVSISADLIQDVEGWDSRAVEFETFSVSSECRTYGARNHFPSMPQPFRAGLTFGRRPSGPWRIIRSHIPSLPHTS